MPRLTYIIPAVLLVLAVMAGVAHATTYQVSGVGGLAYFGSNLASLSGSPTSVTVYLPYNIWASSQYPVVIFVTVYNSGTSTVTTTVSANCFNAPSVSLSVANASSASTTLDVYPPSPGYLGSGSGYVSCTVSTSASGTYFTQIAIDFYMVENITAVNFDNATAYVTLNVPSPLPYYSVGGSNYLFTEYTVYPWGTMPSGYSYPWQIDAVFPSPPYTLSQAPPSGYVNSSAYFLLSISNGAVGETAQPTTFTVSELGGFGVIAGTYSRSGSSFFETAPTVGTIGSAFGYVTLAVTNTSASPEPWDILGITFVTGNIPINQFEYVSSGNAVVQLTVVTPGTYYGLYTLQPIGSDVLPLPIAFNVTINPMPIINNTAFLGNTTDIHGFYESITYPAPAPYAPPNDADAVLFNYAINVQKFLGFPSLVPWINFSESVSFSIFNATHIGKIITIPTTGLDIAGFYQSVLFTVGTLYVKTTINGYGSYPEQILVIPAVNIIPSTATIQPVLWLENTQPYVHSSGVGYTAYTNIVFMGILSVNSFPTAFYLASAHTYYTPLEVWIGGSTELSVQSNVVFPTDLYAMQNNVVYPPTTEVCVTPTSIYVPCPYSYSPMGSGFDMLIWTQTTQSGTTYYAWFYRGLVVAVGLNMTPYPNEVFAEGQTLSGVLHGSEVVAFINQLSIDVQVPSSGTWLLNPYIVYLFAGIPLHVVVQYQNGQPASGYLVSVDVPGIIGLAQSNGTYTGNTPYPLVEVYQPVYGGTYMMLEGKTGSDGTTTLIVPAVWAVNQNPAYVIQVDGATENQTLTPGADSFSGANVTVTVQAVPSVTISSVTVSPNPVQTSPNATFTITVTATYNTAQAPTNLTFTVIFNGVAQSQTVTVPAGSTTYSVQFTLTAPSQPGTYTGTASVASATSSQSAQFTVNVSTTTVSVSGLAIVIAVVLLALAVFIAYRAMRRSGGGGVEIRI